MSPKRSKIYTGRGDKGKTYLIFGEEVDKDNPRVKAYGSLDELNACLGVANSFLKEPRTQRIVEQIQNELFNIGAELASPKRLRKNEKGFFELGSDRVKDLEKNIDQYDSRLPSLRHFILPGGTNTASFLHLARTVSRRAEREIVTLTKTAKVNPNILVYINRLSDFLFVLARYMNKRGGRKETPWKKD